MTFIFFFFEVRHPRCVSNKSNVMCIQYVVKHNLIQDSMLRFTFSKLGYHLVLSCV